MTLLDVEQRARRRRVEGNVLAGVALAVTVVAVGLCVSVLNAAFAGAGALFTSLH